MLFGLTKVLAEHGANIRYVDMHTTADHAEVYLEFAIEGDAARLVADIDPSFMRRRDAGDDRQAEAEAVATAPVAAPEALED